ncbi:MULTISPECIES: Dyp-type peroxidase [unclassified Pseudoclavibacter]|uniref:Dyp-type peroxidase n=1 Tax=unclassified Pseudoclavibacter TaxID=2615177 RepID=UPI0015E2C609|nr:MULTISPECIES: Dyp-type peroxidase [unclassified Pseudoclavibacter]
MPFFGPHQPGIADPTPTHAIFLAFDLRPEAGKAQLAKVMRAWTTIAASFATGDTSVDQSMISHGSGPSMFTMTVGLGGSALDQLGITRPAPLVDLPDFPGDQLDPQSSYGGVFVQLCSDDAVYLGGALRAVRLAAASVLLPRWQMNGFRGVTAATTSSNGRNLMGQIDGTNNIAVSRASTGGAVWVDAASPDWMTGGSYVAVRRFHMLLNSWEAAGAEVRDHTVGRHIATGAPLGAQQESDPVDLDAVDEAGSPVIPADAHIRLAAPRRGAGEEMLRRSYSYSTGRLVDEDGDEDAGLIFISYQSDPTTSFIPVQQRLAESDALNRFTITTSSALFAILPGVNAEGDWYGRALLE